MWKRDSDLVNGILTKPIEKTQPIKSILIKENHYEINFLYAIYIIMAIMEYQVQMNL